MVGGGHYRACGSGASGGTPPRVTTTAPRSLAASFAWIAAAYAAAGLAAWAVAAVALPGAPLWLRVAAADAAATGAVFAFSVALDNSSVYDAYWSVAPMAIAPALCAAGGGAPFARRALVVALVLAWGARLTYNWARGWAGLHHEDWRYVDLRAKTGRAYWAVSFFGIHLFPTALVYLGCLALLPALVTGSRPLGALDLAAALVTAAAVAVEAVADAQLRAFRAAARPGEVMAAGLWACSRHPNYFGEILFWWGLFLFALAADGGAWRAGAGALAITALFVFISVPMLDRRSAARRPEYAAHMRRVSAIVPWPPRGAGEG